MKRTIFANKRGFTLMEVIVAVAIIVTALISSLALITGSISGIRGNKSKIIATGLAQEGLEIVRNMRDNNWLNYKRKADDWRDGLSAGDYRVQFDQESLLSFDSVPLKINTTNGRYQYSDGNNTIYYRKIIIQDINDDQFKVVTEVSWREAGKDNLFSVETRLYNWLKEE